MAGDAILALNAGSSSLKFAVFARDGGSPATIFSGSVQDIGGAAPHFRATAADGRVLAKADWRGRTPEALMDGLVDWIEEQLGAVPLAAVGHRVVHGGRDFSAPVMIDDAVLARLQALAPLAPLHQPASLAPIRHLRTSRPGLPQIACFDTAFHHDMAPPASRYALPRALEAEGIRRYGFHGLSYESVAARLAARDDGARQARIVVAHLGSGASLCALQGLRSVDTTMGFTALDGLVMGTRAGTLDPGILLYLQQARGYSVAQVEQLLYHESGLLGVSGLSSDVSVLLASAAPEAREALDLFAFQVARQTAALAATLGGIDRFIFTGGIGEHAAPMRAMIVARLAWLGAILDDAANAKAAPLISSAASRLRIEILPAAEEAMIAQHCGAMLDEIAGRRPAG